MTNMTTYSNTQESASLAAPMRLRAVQADMAAAAQAAGRNTKDIALLAVSKTHAVDDIAPVIEAGQRAFGENRVQEAAQKWPQLRQQCDDIELHLIGPLQSNKAKQAVSLFDVIQTLDREKLARTLAPMKDMEGFPRLYIQVNSGAEPQKAGILPQDLPDFAALCRELGLTIDGLMCIPPIDEAAGPHFALLGKLADKIGVQNLSMGMSADYQTAIALGATHIRVGTAIFGARGTVDGVK